MNAYSGVIQPDKTVTISGVTYYSEHFLGHGGDRAFIDGQFAHGIKGVTIATTRKTYRVAPLGQELPPPTRLESLALKLGMVAA